jgi:heterodisulfide reductase subunit B
MKTYYYPGCTLPDKARDFDTSARTSCELLGIELSEMERWVCCGSAFKLDRTNVMQHLAPIRNLAEVHKDGGRVMTLCVFCYNSLKRANHAFCEEPDKHETINEFMESEYDGSVEILHLLEILKNEVGFEALRDKVKRPLTGLRVAPFYGCLLLRPMDEIGFEDPENPSVLEDFLAAVGAEVVDYPRRLECCGSYLSLKDQDLTRKTVEKILASAVESGANAIVTSCPMCNFNFEFFGGELTARDRIHVFYFTELLALALGADLELCGLEQHQTDVGELVRACVLDGPADEVEPGAMEQTQAAEGTETEVRESRQPADEQTRDEKEQPPAAEGERPLGDEPNE